MTTEEHIKAVLASGIDHLATPKITFPVAASAIFSKSWVPSISGISETATTWLPILGVTLIILQIAKLVWDWTKPRPPTKT